MISPVKLSAHPSISLPGSVLACLLLATIVEVVSVDTPAGIVIFEVVLLNYIGDMSAHLGVLIL